MVHLLLAGLAVALISPPAPAVDWPMWGRDGTRNAVSPERNPPLHWRIVPPGQPGQSPTGSNLKWAAPLGSVSFATPVIAQGLVWIGTNNEYPHDPDAPGDAGVLLCLREADGRFLWQDVTRHREGLLFDGQRAGIKCSPVIAGDQLWYVTSAQEIVCLDIGPLIRGTGFPRRTWRLDMLTQLEIHPHETPMGWGGTASVGQPYRNLIYAITGNGVDHTHVHIPAPRAPSLVCLNKDTGARVWEDASPGTNIFHTQWSSPLVFELDGRGRVVAGLGDGILRAFDAETGRILWSFDCNPPAYRTRDGRPIRYPSADGPGEFFATPVLHEDRIFIATGQDPEHGEGARNLACVDARTGQAVWQNQVIHRSIGNVCIMGGSVYAADSSGFVHCFVERTGALLWRHDTEASIWGSPLVVDDHLYVVNTDGDCHLYHLPELLGLNRELGTPLTLGKADLLVLPDGSTRSLPGERMNRLRRKIPLNEFMGSSPVYANGVLYLNTTGHLLAISSNAPAPPAPPATTAANTAPDTYYVPTPMDVVRRMLELARVTESDVVYDLGSGDARFLLVAAEEFHGRAVGLELDARLVAASRENVRRRGLEQRITIDEKNFFAADLGPATVVTLFLPPSVLQRLLPKLRALKPGTRVVSHEFLLPGIPPDQSLTQASDEDKRPHTIHLWTLPFKETAPK